MILSMSGQAVLFLTAIAIGFAIGFLYDVIRIFRKIIKHFDIFVQLEDLLYWISVSVIVFYIMLNKNYGDIRFFSIIGCFIGMILYFFTLSGMVIKVSVTVIKFIQKVIKTTLMILFAPIRLLVFLLSFPYRFAASRINVLFFGIKKRLQKFKRYAKIKYTRIKRNMKIVLKKV